MPTPIGHALGGIAAGAMILRDPTTITSVARRRLSILATFGVLGMLADIDFLVFSPHRHATHSLVVGGLIGIMGMAVLPGKPLIWMSGSAAYLSHVFLDWLGADTVEPIGIMALWPFDEGHYQAPISLFLPVCRQYWLLDCWLSIGYAVSYELLIVGPFALAAVLLNRRWR